jgi:TolB-like protein
MSEVFISYARSTADQAHRIAQALRALGYGVWRDDELPPHRAYAEVIEERLRAAKVVVVVWSADAVKSQWVRAEADLARNAGTLVQVSVDPATPPLPFNQIQYADLSNWSGDGDHAHWRKVLASVAELMGRDPPKAPAEAPALKTAVETILAVLPFENLSNDPEMQYFSDGVSEDILGRIARGSRLKIIGRTSSFQFRGADKAKAAAALGATHLVDGSVRRAGNKIRLTAQLTDAASGSCLWSDHYDRSLEDIFAVQDEISEAVAAALDEAFFPQRKTTMDAATYDLYLRVREWQYNPAKIAENVASLEKVVAQAPGFSEGWGRLAVLLGSQRLTKPFAERAPIEARIRDCIETCTKLEPDNIEAGIARFHLLPPYGQFLAQQELADWLQQAGATTPVALNVAVFHLECVGRGREAVAIAETAKRLDPMNAAIRTMHSQSLWRAGRLAEGRQAMAATLHAWPDDHHTAASLIIAAACEQDWAAVDELLDPRRLEQYPLREYAMLVGLTAIMRSGSAEGSAMVLAMLQHRIESTGHVDPMSLVWPAQLGLVKEAYDLADRARFGPSGGPADIMGLNAYRPLMLFAVAFAPLRADPRFVTLCARLGLLDYWLTLGVWPDCADQTPYDFRAACIEARATPREVFP